MRWAPSTVRRRISKVIPSRDLNRVIVQHALQEAGLAGRSIHAVSGLPVSAFYKKNGEQRRDTIEKKRHSLKQAVQPKSERLPAAIAFHEVIPEALAAWYDYVIVTKANEAILDEATLCRCRSPSWTSAGAPPTTWS